MKIDQSIALAALLFALPAALHATAPLMCDARMGWLPSGTGKCCKTNYFAVNPSTAAGSGIPSGGSYYTVSVCLGQVGDTIPTNGHLVITPPFIWPPATNVLGQPPLTNTAATLNTVSYFTNQSLDATGSLLLNTNVYWTAMYWMTLSESSSNLSTWTPYHTVTGWISDAGVLSILYRDSEPMRTNLVVTCSSNSLPGYVLEYSRDADRRFFRVAKENP